MLSYTIGFRQGLSYTFRTFSTVNLDCLDTIWISLDFRQSAAASTKLQQGSRRDEKNQIPAMIALLMLGRDVRGA